MKVKHVGHAPYRIEAPVAVDEMLQGVVGLVLPVDPRHGNRHDLINVLLVYSCTDECHLRNMSVRETNVYIIDLLNPGTLFIIFQYNKFKAIINMLKLHSLPFCIIQLLLSLMNFIDSRISIMQR